MNEPRILFADDHEAMESVVRDQLGMKVSIVGVAHDGVELLSTAEALKPDVILLDISMPRMNGLEAARRLLATMPELRIIFLTVHNRPFYVTEAFRLGAHGYVLKGSAHELPIAIDRVMQGDRFLSATLQDAYPELIPTDLHG
ncbi:MAG: response regulator transcription factor [Candidatus Sericytochromatia bacterium]|uniref:Response regulator transcription factor n=1 Tax=Candidatus Tanganyikabacteria bacterium TaxID=2961651 RepID=A0A938BL85_9BACT|nr:response regulator transcription factor [Candidatus Tanganyikabacteria bacterium]